MIWLIFGLLAVAGAAFAAAPLVRRRTVAATAIAALVAASGLGLYATLGRPDLAARAFADPSTDDVPALVASLSRAVRQQPNNLQAWMWLGQGYFALGATRESAKAYRVAVQLAETQHRLTPSAMSSLLAQYGVALSQAEGAVGDDAEAAFRQATVLDPKNAEARFYLGIAAASRGDNARAQALWEALLADSPADAPFRADLVDRLAALKAREPARGEAPPDVQAMVAGLASRLKDNPNDLDGWRRLIRSYAVLGDVAKARAALGDARKIFGSNTAALATLAAAAHENRLE